jgi:hypothetical protein
MGSKESLEQAADTKLSFQVSLTWQLNLLCGYLICLETYQAAKNLP